MANEMSINAFVLLYVHIGGSRPGQAQALPK